jgi:hypothetical protein
MSCHRLQPHIMGCFILACQPCNLFSGFSSLQANHALQTPGARCQILYSKAFAAFLCALLMHNCIATGFTLHSSVYFHLLERPAKAQAVTVYRLPVSNFTLHQSREHFALLNEMT